MSEVRALSEAAQEAVDRSHARIVARLDAALNAYRSGALIESGEPEFSETGDDSAHYLDCKGGDECHCAGRTVKPSRESGEPASEPGPVALSFRASCGCFEQRDTGSVGLCEWHRNRNMLDACPDPLAHLAASLPAPVLSPEPEQWPDHSQPPRYRWTETGMVLDSKGAYVLAHMVAPTETPGLRKALVRVLALFEGSYTYAESRDAIEQARAALGESVSPEPGLRAALRAVVEGCDVELEGGAANDFEREADAAYNWVLSVIDGALLASIRAELATTDGKPIDAATSVTTVTDPPPPWDRIERKEAGLEP